MTALGCWCVPPHPGMAAELSAPAPHQQLWASLSLLLLPSLVFRKHGGWGCYTRYPRKKLLVHLRAKETLCGYREPPGQPSPAAPEQLQAKADHPPAKSPQFPQTPAFCLTTSPLLCPSHKQVGVRPRAGTPLRAEIQPLTRRQTQRSPPFLSPPQLLSNKLSALPLRDGFKSLGNGNHINSRGGTGRTALCSF